MKKRNLMLWGLIILLVTAMLCTGGLAEESVSENTGVTLRVGTFNIANGRDAGYDFSLLAELINSLELDIVGVQEVDVGTDRVPVPDGDALKALAEAAGFEYYAFAKAMEYGGGDYGTAILSHYPIISHEVTLMKPTIKMAIKIETRAFGHAVIDVQGKQIDFFNTHLSYEDRALRNDQFPVLAEQVNLCPGYIVTGDFNTGSEYEFRLFNNAQLVNSGSMKKLPGNSKSSIDNIVLDQCWVILDRGILETDYSDHNLVWAEIQLSE